MPYTENCLFLEASPGDGGVHDASSTWWLSPDVDIIAPTAGQGTGPRASGDPDVDNRIGVRLHKKSDCTGLTSQRVFVDVFVGDPSLAMTRGANTKWVHPPGTSASDPSAKVSVTALASGSSTEYLIWRLPYATSGIEAPGHKCLIAQIYQEDDTPPSNFGMPTEPHTAQHNITICPCASPCGQVIQTTAPGKKPEMVSIKALFEGDPSQRVDRMARALIQAAKIKDFRRIRTVPPPSFGFVFPPKLGAKIRDFKATSRRESKQPPNCTASLSLRPGKAVSFRLVTDLAFASFGDAFIFHVVQTGQNRQPQGGLTVVFLRTSQRF